MKKNISQEIREKWISFFKNKGHYLIPRSNLIPIEDESLLFINSGIATIKKYFEGKETPPSKRLVNIQPVIRTNDINSVGYTTRHHTFFEMLGNFSISDYFKEEAINYAWEFLTKKDFLNIKPELLYITVYEDDQETIELWKKLKVNPEHIFKMGKDTNFWDMGIGPCGPSTEIFYDKGKKFSKKTAEELIKNDIENDRFIEIWNIVFSEFNNDGEGNYRELPQKNIDTGAGLERIVSCLQKTPSNFETNLFLPIITEIEKYTSFKYTKHYNPEELKEKFQKNFALNVAFKGIADFIRASVFIINDGVIPGNSGRGYVLRKLLRKSLIFGWRLKIQKPFLYKLTDITIASLENYYPELKIQKNQIQEIILCEEEQFFLTVKNAMNQFNKEKLENFDENLAFKYYETYGLPFEFIEEFIKSKNIDLDRQKLDNLYADFKEKSKNSFKKSQPLEQQKEFFNNISKTEFVGYEHFLIKAKVIAKNDNYVVFDRTPFYATSGGQISDIGYGNEFIVSEVEKNSQGVFIHHIIDNNFKIGQTVELAIDTERREIITINHSATHLLFSALEKILDTKLLQVGSMVSEKELRFDFNYKGKIVQHSITEATKLANKWIKSHLKTKTIITSIEEAKKMGATFLDGKKYPQKVRVVILNEQTIDLCGGTHVKLLRDIEKIEVINFERRGSGIYRINAIATNEKIIKYKIKRNSTLLDLKLSEFQKEFFKIKSRKKFLPKTFDLNFLYQKLDKIKKNDLKSKNWFERFEASSRRINQHIEKYFAIEKTTLLDKLKEFIEKNKEDDKLFKTFVLVENFTSKELIKDLLRMMAEQKDQILILTLINNQKATIMLIISENFTKTEKVQELIKKMNQIGLRGGGSKRLYIFGGQEELIKKLEGEYEFWEL